LDSARDENRELFSVKSFSANVNSKRQKRQEPVMPLQLSRTEKWR
jgi:hypothetical protein